MTPTHPAKRRVAPSHHFALYAGPRAHRATAAPLTVGSRVNNVLNRIEPFYVAAQTTHGPTPHIACAGWPDGWTLFSCRRSKDTYSNCWWRAAQDTPAFARSTTTRLLIILTTRRT
jgi:hypothetical protein